MRSKTDDDVQVLPDRLIVQVKTVKLNNMLQDIRNSIAESSMPARGWQSTASIQKREDER